MSAKSSSRSEVPDTPWRLSATDLAASFRRGELAPDTHLDMLLERIERLNPQLNALVAVDPHARDAAGESASRLRSGAARGALQGIPVAVKDNIFVRGMPTTWGSRYFRDAVCAEDEPRVSRCDSRMMPRVLEDRGVAPGRRWRMTRRWPHVRGVTGHRCGRSTIDGSPTPPRERS